MIVPLIVVLLLVGLGAVAYYMTTMESYRVSEPGTHIMKAKYNLADPSKWSNDYIKYGDMPNQQECFAKCNMDPQCMAATYTGQLKGLEGYCVGTKSAPGAYKEDSYANVGVVSMYK